MTGAPRTLVLGMGNPILSDDAVGIRLARDLKARLGELPNLFFCEECSVGGLNLLDHISGYDRLVVLDSIQTRGGEPGAWYYFDATRLRDSQNVNNIHDVNFSTALELGRRLGHHLPDDSDIHIFAVEVEDNVTFSETMTDVLEARYPECLEEILQAVRETL
ncbi:hydrogenase maturation protease [Candidatus Sumerlaeota bacterium]|nr:hydrogenase maturation protease [Candidatus Sumerlaeota bacterium]